MPNQHPRRPRMDTHHMECPPGTNRFEWLLFVQAPLVREQRQAANERRRREHEHREQWGRAPAEKAPSRRD